VISDYTTPDDRPLGNFVMTDYPNQLSEGFRDAVRHSEENPPQKTHGTLRSSVCGTSMPIEEVLGLTTNTCTEHGVWLDTGELPAIIDQVRSGTRRAASHAIAEANARGKGSGIFFGAFSPLFDPFRTSDL